MDDNGDNGL